MVPNVINQNDFYSTYYFHKTNRKVVPLKITDNSLPGCLGIIVTCTCTVLLYFCSNKRQIWLNLKKLFHSSTSHTYHHNSSWTIRQARNYMCSKCMISAQKLKCPSSARNLHSSTRAGKFQLELI
jgi:hypothetical protein